MSRHHRLGAALAPGATVVVEGGAAHHLERVLRVRVGARFVGVGVAGEAHEVEVVALAPLTVRVGDSVALGADPVGSLEVWVPLLKGGRTDDLVRQLTELGASRVVPWSGAHSVVRLDAKRARSRVERWRAIAREATSQCGRLTVPEIADVAGLPDAGPGVFFWVDADAPARDALSAVAAETGALRVLVGPEGGLSAEEAGRLVTRGWRPAWLGRRVLRAETAVLAAATLALHALGEGGY